MECDGDREHLAPLRYVPDEWWDGSLQLWPRQGGTGGWKRSSLQSLSLSGRRRFTRFACFLSLWVNLCLFLPLFKSLPLSSVASSLLFLTFWFSFPKHFTLIHQLSLCLHFSSCVFPLVSAHRSLSALASSIGGSWIKKAYLQYHPVCCNFPQHLKLSTRSVWQLLPFFLWSHDWVKQANTHILHKLMEWVTLCSHSCIFIQNA